MHQEITRVQHKPDRWAHSDLEHEQQDLKESLQKGWRKLGFSRISAADFPVAWTVNQDGYAEEADTRVQGVVGDIMASYRENNTADFDQQHSAPPMVMLNKDHMVLMSLGKEVSVDGSGRSERTVRAVAHRKIPGMINGPFMLNVQHDFKDTISRDNLFDTSNAALGKTVNRHANNMAEIGEEAQLKTYAEWADGQEVARAMIVDAIDQLADGKNTHIRLNEGYYAKEATSEGLVLLAVFERLQQYGTLAISEYRGNDNHASLPGHMHIELNTDQPPSRAQHTKLGEWFKQQMAKEKGLSTLLNQLDNVKEGTLIQRIATLYPNDPLIKGIVTEKKQSTEQVALAEMQRQYRSVVGSYNAYVRELTPRVSRGVMGYGGSPKEVLQAIDLGKLQPNLFTESANPDQLVASTRVIQAAINTLGEYQRKL